MTKKNPLTATSKEPNKPFSCRFLSKSGENFSICLLAPLLSGVSCIGLKTINCYTFNITKFTAKILYKKKLINIHIYWLLYPWLHHTAIPTAEWNTWQYENMKNRRLNCEQRAFNGVHRLRELMSIPHTFQLTQQEFHIFFLSSIFHPWTNWWIFIEFRKTIVKRLETLSSRVSGLSIIQFYLFSCRL